MKKKPSQASSYSTPRRIELGKRLRALRLSKGLTMVDLAVKCDTDSSYIGRIERGEINPGFDSLDNVCTALDTDLIAILFK